MPQALAIAEAAGSLLPERRGHASVTCLVWTEAPGVWPCSAVSGHQEAFDPRDLGVPASSLPREGTVTGKRVLPPGGLPFRRAWAQAQLVLACALGAA